MVLTDEKLKKDIVDQLYWDSSIDAAQIRFEVSDGMATLSGAVHTYGDRVAAEHRASSVRGVKNLENKLEVHPYPGYEPPTDEQIHKKIEDLLTWLPWVLSKDIEIAVDRGHVTLIGSVDEFWKKWKAENLLHSLHGVTNISNHLVVVPTERIVDKAIANYIEAALDRDVYMFAEDVNVKVENGTVTLTGQVPSWYARWRAFDIAAVTPGVIQVSQELEIP